MRCLPNDYSTPRTYQGKNKMSVQDTPTRDSLRLESDKLVYDWGWIDCEERIIKLLEQRATLMGKCKDTECVCRQSAIDFEYAIELIKGQEE
jgi:hypothetical protein